MDATIAAAAVATAAGARRRSSEAFAFFGAPSVLDAIATMGAGRVRRCAGPARRDRTTDGVEAIVACIVVPPRGVESERALWEVRPYALSLVSTPPRK